MELYLILIILFVVIVVVVASIIYGKKKMGLKWDKKPDENSDGYSYSRLNSPYNNLQYVETQSFHDMYK